MPVTELAEPPSIDRAPETISETLPAFPDAYVPAVIKPPPEMLADPAETRAEPALPDPDVVTEMTPLLLIDREPAFTLTVPAGPTPKVCANTPVRAVAPLASIDKVPGTFSETPPAPPWPTVKLPS